jgi:hypothetical protein
MLQDSLTQDILYLDVVHSFQRKRARRGPSGAYNRAPYARVVHSLAKGRSARRSPETPQRAPRRWPSRKALAAEKPSSARGMVEAVGIEPTSDGQSPQTTTSVSCVLGSRRRRPQAGLPRR